MQQPLCCFVTWELNASKFPIINNYWFLYAWKLEKLKLKLKIYAKCVVVCFEISNSSFNTTAGTIYITCIYKLIQIFSHVVKKACHTVWNNHIVALQNSLLHMQHGEDEWNILQQSNFVNKNPIWGALPFPSTKRVQDPIYVHTHPHHWLPHFSDHWRKMLFIYIYKQYFNRYIYGIL